MSKKDKLNTDDAALPKIVDKAFNETIGNEEMVTFPEINPTIDELEAEEKIMEDVEDEDDLDKKKYIKITPTFYVQSVKNENKDDETELFKILNPVEGIVETRELTDEEKRDIIVNELKESRVKFRNTTHDGNKTKTRFGVKYKQKRKRTNALKKKSRKANR